MLNLPAGVAFSNSRQVQHVPPLLLHRHRAESHRHVPARRVDRKGRGQKERYQGVHPREAEMFLVITPDELEKMIRQMIDVKELC